jgi:hypothetical protein
MVHRALWPEYMDDLSETALRQGDGTLRIDAERQVHSSDVFQSRRVMASCRPPSEH